MKTLEGEAHSSAKSIKWQREAAWCLLRCGTHKQEILDLMRVFKADVGRVLSGSLGIDPADVWGVIPTTEEGPKSSSPIESEPEGKSGSAYGG
jgi:hypothetical protein